MRKKTVMLGFLLAVSMILSYIESIFPLAIGIPGVKLGLPNLIVVLLLSVYGGREALTVNVFRIVLTGFLFGNLYAVLYALAGAACSFCAMFLFQKTGRFSIIGISVGGGVFHNVGQLLVAMAVVETFAPAFYFPFLLCAGVFTGFVIGIVAKRVLPYLERITKMQE
ncbi:MAG: Gx transporter family protein [Blautia sp.]|nr:Gx transporter family protein [Lachnoclostridium sp.]MCM1210909.1 Gx transporter family protein [Blautia sp.]